VFRKVDADGRLVADALTLAGMAGAGIALLEPVMRNGRLVRPLPALAAARAHAARELAALPLRLRSLDPAAPYSVVVAQPVRALAEAVDALD
jgi:nicotinate phosphoribosyltransferase